MMKKHRYGSWSLLAMVSLLSACNQAEAPQQQDRPVVEVIAVEPRAFTPAQSLPGRLEAVRVAQVRARVAGIVLQRHFEEGAHVQAGETLFQIDPAPMRAAVARAQAELARSEAALTEARAVVRRYEPLVKIEAVSQQDFDAAQASLGTALANRQAAQASLETARLDLQYATVTAPISGRIGRALVTEGALVGQGEATPMAIIQQIDPIHADFKQSAADLLRLQDALAQGTLQQDRQQAGNLSLSVEGSDKTYTGELLFSDITVDPSTGQVSLRGRFANADGRLLPGMYVRVTTSSATDPEAILVPQRAIQRGLDGQAQVLLVGDEDLVEVRQVRTGTMQGHEWHILEGLAAGDRVIVGGLGGAQPGQPVEIADHAAKP